MCINHTGNPIYISQMDFRYGRFIAPGYISGFSGTVSALQNGGVMLSLSKYDARQHT
jgi:hypothetical protein